MAAPQQLAPEDPAAAAAPGSLSVPPASLSARFSEALQEYVNPNYVMGGVFVGALALSFYFGVYVVANLCVRVRGVGRCSRSQGMVQQGGGTRRRSSGPSRTQM
jgi:hypothetical protein